MSNNDNIFNYNLQNKINPNNLSITDKDENYFQKNLPEKYDKNILYSNYIKKLKIFSSKFSETFFDKIKFSLDLFNNFLNNQPLFKKDKIFLAFNGGKDCLATYILIKYYFFCEENIIDYSASLSFQTFCMDKNKNYCVDPKYKIKLVYFMNKKNFESEEEYVFNFSLREKIEIIYIYSDYISGLKFLIKNFNLKWIIMGTRKDDIKETLQNENLIHESTDPYPKFIRFYPVFKFDYEDIWKLILLSKIEYLELYDKGYSSIGNKLNTKVNENLIFKINEIEKSNLFLPAWCLMDSFSERNFRDSELVKVD